MSKYGFKPGDIVEHVDGSIYFIGAGGLVRGMLVETSNAKWPFILPKWHYEKLKKIGEVE